MLLRRQNFLVDREMQMIRRAVVYDLNFRIRQQSPVVAVPFGNRKLLGLGLRKVVAALGNRRHFHKPKPPQRLDVRGANESSADDACFDFGHSYVRLRVFVRR